MVVIVATAAGLSYVAPIQVVENAPIEIKDVVVAVPDKLPEGILPNPTITPGAINPEVTQANIATTICKSGWTATIRPPSSYTTALKKRQIDQYGFTDKTLGSYEEDHLISLQLGGDPVNSKNLWPQPYNVVMPDGRKAGARQKDVVETNLKRRVCSGQMTLAEAQREIATNWWATYVAIKGVDTRPPADDGD